MAKGDVREAVESGLAWEATARRAEKPACREGAEPRRLTLASMVALVTDVRVVCCGAAQGAFRGIQL
jgi:hypothetical protein